jgi:hypothetical protein
LSVLRAVPEWSVRNDSRSLSSSLATGVSVIRLGVLVDEFFFFFFVFVVSVVEVFSSLKEVEKILLDFLGKIYFFRF